LVPPVPPPSGITLKMNAGGTSNMLLNTCWTMWCHNC
jgi:hypothetical protein